MGRDKGQNLYDIKNVGDIVGPFKICSPIWLLIDISIQKASILYLKLQEATLGSRQGHWCVDAKEVTVKGKGVSLEVIKIDVPLQALWEMLGSLPVSSEGLQDFVGYRRPSNFTVSVVDVTYPKGNA